MMKKVPHTLYNGTKSVVYPRVIAYAVEYSINFHKRLKETNLELM